MIKWSSALSRAWRRVLQPVAFALFGVGAWILAVSLFPLLWITPVSADRKASFIQKVLHYFFRLFLWFLQVAQGMVFTVQGAEALRAPGGGLVIANHPTLLDVVLLIAQMPQADCIVKKELWHNFFLRGIVSSAGFIPNDDGPGLLAAAIDRVRRGRKVIIFPEGTRSLPDGMRPFNNGFAHIAVRAPCPMWPVVLRCEPPALAKGAGIFEVPAERAHLSAAVQEPLKPQAYYDAADPKPLSVRKLSAAMRHYFEQKVNDGRS